ncbi:Dihydrolipoyllysine-residue acetyltransferase component of pyruvate dehydrogenase complex [Pontiella desulfatans]|uniref:Dihydrolipoamide acetyltransferase component of pyruvate dehydrogenase complex n=1 Tax=Pontiella desulfatans TaxID=2750659 RepID=A0A6C2TZQ6_PONDE|nr:dihydrolipoamide acetyltransferase family protein [Pontiella desulfatans]VGO12944.1 Dihydrolipoyllysine-residue acetyltransferase component of pyruvate dehydrogenase complex [Pontiella desulfatans]
MATEVLMPRQGQSVESCIIIEWKVNEGDVVTEGQALCEVETDKATFEVEATASGTVLGIFYPADADVDVLKVIAAIGDPGEDISALRPADEAADTTLDAGSSEEKAPVVEEKPVVASIQPQASSVTGLASPRAKNLAEKKGVDISTVAGSGPGGRVIERDVAAAQAVTPAAAAKAAAEGLAIPAAGTGMGGRVTAADLMAVAPEAVAEAVASMDFPGTVKEIPVKGVRKVVAGRMLNSLQSTAQLTLNTSADARSVLGYRSKCKNAPEEAGVGGISINDVVLYATIKTLGEFPELNAHMLGNKIVEFDNVHLGFAVDTPRGLMVPVIRYANLMTLKQLSAETKRLATACIEGTIDPDALSGGTFTVTNLGAMGIESFTPVLNAPEVGILGVCSIQPKPVMKGADVEFVPHMGLSLTFDHAAADGAPAARFLASMRTKLAAFELTLAG